MTGIKWMQRKWKDYIMRSMIMLGFNLYFIF